MKSMAAGQVAGKVTKGSLENMAAGIGNKESSVDTESMREFLQKVTVEVMDSYSTDIDIDFEVLAIFHRVHCTSLLVHEAQK